jgi:hypothetical protein
MPKGVTFLIGQFAPSIVRLIRKILEEDEPVPSPYSLKDFLNKIIMLYRTESS